MIPYEELVYALQNWRVKQGLPVTATVDLNSGSGEARTAPPMAPPHAGVEEVDDALVEEAHEAGADAPPHEVRHDDDDATAIGEIPSADGAEVASDAGAPGRNEDW